ncbi:MAG: HAD-IA family hydrolase [Pseudomonadota bacterium]
MAEAGRVRAVLFDLDGTLVDTAPDLIDTLNTLRHCRGLPPMEAHLLRPQASHGTQGLIRLGLGVGADHPDFPGLRSEFLDIYQANLSRRSRLFPEMGQVLEVLEGRGLAWGVVTNKPAFLTEPLLDQLGLGHRAACVVSGDTCARNKPHPEPVLHACRHMTIAPGDCIYVGDAARDVEAARAAGMPALVALYGYLGETDQPAEWGASGFIRSPLGLMDWLNQA